MLHVLFSLIVFSNLVRALSPTVRSGGDQYFLGTSFVVVDNFRFESGARCVIDLTQMPKNVPLYVQISNSLFVDQSELRLVGFASTSLANVPGVNFTFSVTNTVFAQGWIRVQNAIPWYSTITFASNSMVMNAVNFSAFAGVYAVVINFDKVVLSSSTVVTFRDMDVGCSVAYSFSGFGSCFPVAVTNSLNLLNFSALQFMNVSFKADSSAAVLPFFASPTLLSTIFYSNSSITVAKSSRLVFYGSSFTLSGFSQNSSTLTSIVYLGGTVSVSNYSMVVFKLCTFQSALDISNDVAVLQMAAAGGNVTGGSWLAFLRCTVLTMGSAANTLFAFSNLTISWTSSVAFADLQINVSLSGSLLSSVVRASSSLIVADSTSVIAVRCPQMNSSSLNISGANFSSLNSSMVANVSCQENCAANISLVAAPYSTVLAFASDCFPWSTLDRRLIVGATYCTCVCRTTIGIPSMMCAPWYGYSTSNSFTLQKSFSKTPTVTVTYSNTLLTWSLEASQTTTPSPPVQTESRSATFSRATKSFTAEYSSEASLTRSGTVTMSLSRASATVSLSTQRSFSFTSTSTPSHSGPTASREKSVSFSRSGSFAGITSSWSVTKSISFTRSMSAGDSFTDSSTLTAHTFSFSTSFWHSKSRTTTMTVSVTISSSLSVTQDLSLSRQLLVTVTDSHSLSLNRVTGTVTETRTMFTINCTVSRGLTVSNTTTQTVSLSSSEEKQTQTKSLEVSRTRTLRLTISHTFTPPYIPNITIAECPQLALHTLPLVVLDTDISTATSNGLVKIYVEMVGTTTNSTQWVTSPHPLVVTRGAPAQPSVNGFVQTVSQRNMTCLPQTLHRIVCTIPTTPALQIDSYEYLNVYVSSGDILGGCSLGSSPAKELKLLYAGSFLISASKYSSAALVGQGISGAAASIGLAGSLLSSAAGCPPLLLIGMVRSSSCSSGSSDATTNIIQYITMPFRDLGFMYGMVGNIGLVLMALAVNAIVYAVKAMAPVEHNDGSEEKDEKEAKPFAEEEMVDQPSTIAAAASAREVEVQIRETENAAKKKKERALYKEKALRAVRLPDFALLAAVLMFQGTLDYACKLAFTATDIMERSVASIGFLYAAAVPLGMVLVVRYLLEPHPQALPIGLPVFRGEVVLPESLIKNPKPPRPLVRFVMYRTFDSKSPAVQYASPVGFWYPKNYRRRFNTILFPLRGNPMMAVADGDRQRGLLYFAMLYPFITTAAVTMVVRSNGYSCSGQLWTVLAVFLVIAFLVGILQPHRCRLENLLALLTYLSLVLLTAAEIYGINSPPSDSLETVKAAVLAATCVVGILRVAHCAFVQWKENADWIDVEELPIHTDEATEARKLEKEALLKVAQLMVEERKMQKQKEAEERAKAEQAAKEKRLLALLDSSSDDEAPTGGLLAIPELNRGGASATSASALLDFRSPALPLQQQQQQGNFGASFASVSILSDKSKHSKNAKGVVASPAVSLTSSRSSSSSSFTALAKRNSDVALLRKQGLSLSSKPEDVASRRSNESKRSRSTVGARDLREVEPVIFSSSSSASSSSSGFTSRSSSSASSRRTSRSSNKSQESHKKKLAEDLDFL